MKKKKSTSNTNMPGLSIFQHSHTHILEKGVPKRDVEHIYSDHFIGWYSLGQYLILLLPQLCKDSKRNLSVIRCDLKD